VPPLFPPLHRPLARDKVPWARDEAPLAGDHLSFPGDLIWVSLVLIELIGLRGD